MPDAKAKDAPATVRWHEPTPSTRLARADWLSAARSLQPQSIDLLYTDPPFATGREHTASAGTFSDVWPDLNAYLDWLRVRLTATIPALTPNGAILLHIDWRTSHHARIILEDLLGPESFINSLVWSYGLGGSSPRRFARKHDDILYYSPNPDHCYFNPPMVPATSRKMAGQLKKATDVINIPALNNMATERVGYPTQKPLALLELLINACCPPGGTVFDPCCGSGTTLVAAQRTERRAVGSDISPDAITTTTARLIESQQNQELPPRIASSPAGNG